MDVRISDSKEKYEIDKYKIIVMFIILAIASFLTYYFHVILRTGIIFTHFFYIPIILAATWWKRKGLIVVIFLAALLILSDFIRTNTLLGYDDISRIFMFMVVGSLAAGLSEMVAQVEEELRKAYDESNMRVEEQTAELSKSNALLKQDITERKLAEEALKESEERYRLLVMFSPYGIAIHSEGRFVFMNQAGAKILGAANPEELIGIPVLQIIHPDYRELVKERIRMQEEGKAAPLKEEKLLRVDGTSVDVELASIPYTYKGKPAMYGVFLDITERKRGEEELRKYQEHLEDLVRERTGELQESELKYRTLYESSSDAIMLLDEKGFFDCNKATLHMFGFLKNEDFVKVHLADVSPPYQPDGTDSQTAANNKISEAFRKGVNSFEWMHRRKNGEDFPAEVLLTAMQFNGKKVLQATVRDITERKKNEEAFKIAREKAENANIVKTNFIHTMSHELRTPLNAVLGFSEMLNLRTFGELNEKQEQAINNIITGGNNLLKIISQIFDLIKMDEGRLELQMEKIHVPEILEEVIHVIKEKAANKNVLFEKNIDPELEYIEADKQKFKQVFIHILDNAVKFSKEEGGTVTINAKKEGDMAMFSVSDRGIGIKEEDLEKIFHTFSQLDSGTSRKYGGAGIGLAITKQFMELHGGRIWVKSKYGEGSTFTFTIPLKEKQ